MWRWMRTWGFMQRRTEDIALVPRGRGSIGGCDEVHPEKKDQYLWLFLFINGK